MWEPTNAGKVFEDQLLVNPDIDLVFTHAAHLTVPIVAIMEAKGMKPGQIMMMASNGAPSASTTSARAGSRSRSSSRPMPRSMASRCSRPRS